MSTCLARGPLTATLAPPALFLRSVRQQSLPAMLHRSPAEAHQDRLCRTVKCCGLRVEVKTWPPGVTVEVSVIVVEVPVDEEVVELVVERVDVEVDVVV